MSSLWWGLQMVPPQPLPQPSPPTRLCLNLVLSPRHPHMLDPAGSSAAPPFALPFLPSPRHFVTRVLRMGSKYGLSSNDVARVTPDI